MTENTSKKTDSELVRIVQEARNRLTSTWWRHVGSGGQYVALGITLRETDLEPMVRYYPHGKRGFEFCRPIDEFLERFEPTPVPLYTGLPA
jgi:hypothetical protein